MSFTASQSSWPSVQTMRDGKLAMILSSSDIANLAFLELIDEGVEPPDGLDINKLADDGLVAQRSRGWMLTHTGLLRLQNLQSLARSLPHAGAKIAG